MTNVRYKIILHVLNQLEWFNDEQAAALATKWFDNANSIIEDSAITAQYNQFCLEYGFR